MSVYASVTIVKSCSYGRIQHALYIFRSSRKHYTVHHSSQMLEQAIWPIAEYYTY